MKKQKGQGLSSDEAHRLLEGYERSGLSQRAYCQQIGIPVSTFDYYRRRQAREKQATLLPVQVLNAAQRDGFTLILPNGRRIEGNWDFEDAGLVRLVQIAEQA